MPKGGVVAISTANDCVNEATPLGSGVMPAGDYVRIERARFRCGHPQEACRKDLRSFFTTQAGPVRGRGLASPRSMESSSRPGASSPSIAKSEKAPSLHLSGPATRREICRLSNRNARSRATSPDRIRSCSWRTKRPCAARGPRPQAPRYRVLEAAGGEEALELVRRHEGAIHLLITDVVMPNMDRAYARARA